MRIEYDPLNPNSDPFAWQRANTTINHNFHYEVSIATKIINAIVNLVFLGFTIYAIAVSNKETVFDACGKNLWGFMIARVVIGGSFLVIIGTAAIPFLLLMAFKDTIQASTTLPCLLFLAVMYQVTVLALGVKFSSDAMGNSACTTALSDVSFTNSPLLAQLTYVFVAFDSIWILLSLCLCAVGTTVAKMFTTVTYS